MPPSHPFHPCLPTDFLQELREDPNIPFDESHIHAPSFEKFRTKVLNPQERTPTELALVVEAPSGPLSLRGLGALPTVLARGLPPNHRRVEELHRKVSNFRSEDRKTFLHQAAACGDIPLAYEVVRVGVNINHKDQNGITALFLATVNIAAHDSDIHMHEVMSSTHEPPPSPHHHLLQKDCLEKIIARHARIATMLVQQHADVNSGAFGANPLSLAAQACSWPLVELLLQHGAHPVPANDIPFRSQHEKSHYSSLLKKKKALGARPARPCPCWSGTTLPRCHASSKEHPYPSHFVCCCGRKRIFAECCGKRGIVIVEKWDYGNKRIMPIQKRSVSIPIKPSEEHFSPSVRPLIQEGSAHLADLARNMRSCDLQDILNQTTTPIDVALLKENAARAGRKDCFDNAYWYALEKTNFFPRPQSWGQLSKVECRSKMEEWNSAVDEYMQTEGQFRDPFDVEYEAKIGLDGGPLYKTCSAKGCNIIEKYDMPSLMKCSGCNVELYCSKPCQKNSWKDHKQACKSGDVQPPLSNTQWQMEGLVQTTQAATGFLFKAGYYN